MTAALVVGAAVTAAWLVAVPRSPARQRWGPGGLPPPLPPDAPASRPGPGAPHGTRPAALRRHRWPVAVLAGAGAAVAAGGPLTVPVGVVVAVLVLRAASRLEPPGSRRRREELRRHLPLLVELLAATLAAGLAPVRALAVVADALPDAVATELAPVAAQAALGVPEAAIWRGLAQHPVLGPLGRVLARSADSGAPVAVAVRTLAAELADAARADVEDRARSVGVRAALPLGLCLLPAFLLLGIVPLVAGAFASLAW